ncbi:PA2779 family protein [Sulfurifustis variabilis]|nr:PA2779 family protein [Sulfurifustis variabilis]
MTSKRPRTTETLLMDTLRRLSRPLSHLVVLGLLALSVHVPAAQAAIVTTDAIVSAQQADEDRARVKGLLDREDVKRRLAAAGVNPTDVAARVDALSDTEVHALAGKMDELPAGGDALGVLVFVFVVLLITDILGFTDIFPFVKKPVRR